MTTVDREQLIALLTDRTGMDRDRVDQQLGELINQIQKAEAKQKTFTIEGFGTFKAVQDRLEFVPSKVLDTEINNRYAGMKPIELIGAFKQPAGKDMHVADLSDEEEPPQKTEEPQKEEQPEAKPKEEARDSVSESAVPVDQPEKKTAAEPEEDTELEKDPKEAQQTEEPVVPAAEAEESPATTGDSLSEDPLGKAIVIVVVILTLAVAGWLAYDLGLFGPNDTEKNNTSSSETPVEQQNVDQSAAGIPDEGASENTEDTENPAENTAESEAKDNETASESVETAAYGLYGEPNEDLNNGFYTIVVHSLQTMDLAEEKKQILVEEGFRTQINEADVSGSAYYRVGIGQFSTVQAAQEAVQELPEPYKSNNFINRF